MGPRVAPDRYGKRPEDQSKPPSNWFYGVMTLFTRSFGIHSVHSRRRLSLRWSAWASQSAIESLAWPQRTAKLNNATSTKALKDKEILRDEEKLGQKGTRFEDPFFAAWIMMVTS